MAHRLGGGNGCLFARHIGWDVKDMIKHGFDRLLEGEEKGGDLSIWYVGDGRD